MSAYANLTREQLVSRIQLLEGKLGPAAALPVRHARKDKKPGREFDWSSSRGRKVALRISYLGHNYHGFTGSLEEEQPTVEGQLFKALTTCKLIPSPDDCGWSRAGRTDKGWQWPSYCLGTASRPLTAQVSRALGK